MGKTEFGKGLQLQRVAAMPHNPHLKEEVQKLRQKYAIPADVEKAKEWFFHDHITKYDKVLFPIFYGKSTTSSSAKAENIYETEVPVELDIVALLLQFQLPLYVFINLLWYVIEDDEIWLAPIAFAPRVYFSFDSKKGLPESKVTITSLGAWTTKKQWDELWYRKVKKEVAKSKRVYEELFGVADLPRKRSTLESYREQMKRYSEWYQLSEIEGLGPVKALDKWEEEHPDQSGRFDLSTVTKAIKEFRQIITPTFIIKD